MIDAGFVLTLAGSDASLAVSKEPQPIASHTSVWRACDREYVVLGRLYYRDDRLQWLRTRIASAELDACRVSDAAMVATLFREGGVHALAALEGDFVAAGFDRVRRQLVAIRDPIGPYPLFWTANSRTIAISTSIRALISHLPRVAIDDQYVADYLSLPINSFAELPSQRTACLGVSRLLPGWMVESGWSPNDVTCRRLWQWPNEPERRISIADAAVLVRERLEAAVAERINRSRGVACHFSGGLDSTGVGLLAEPMLRHARPLFAMTLTFSTDPGLAMEGTEAARAAAERSRIEHRQLIADDICEFDDHELAPGLDEPSPMVVDLRQSCLLAEAARGAGADTILTGDGADQLFHHPPHALVVELLRRIQVRRAVDLARSHARARTRSPWPIMREAIASLAPRRLRGAGASRFEEMSDLRIPPWFRRDFAMRMKLRDRMMALRPPRFDGRLFAIGDIPSMAGDWYHWNVAAPRGILQTRPYLDPRVISLSLSLPSELSYPPRPFKPVLAAALAGVVPASIVNRTYKPNFGVMLSGFVRHRSWLEQLVREAPLDDAMIDRQALLESVNKAALGAFRDARSLGRLRLTLTYLMWLSTHRSTGVA